MRPVKLRIHSTDLAVDVQRGIGFSGRCACGWVGPIRREHRQARDDARAHRFKQHE